MRLGPSFFSARFLMLTKTYTLLHKTFLSAFLFLWKIGPGSIHPNTMSMLAISTN